MSVNWRAEAKNLAEADPDAILAFANRYASEMVGEEHATLRVVVADQAVELARLRAENALARDTAFWLDCRWKAPSEESRSPATCGLEGTHVCALCQLAGSRAENEALRENVKALEAEEEYDSQIVVTLRDKNAALTLALERMREALAQIALGAGPFSRDPLIHCSNTVEEMKRLASEALFSSPRRGEGAGGG